MNEFDVIIGLGHLVNPDGTLSDQTNSRAVRCVDRYYQKLAKRIIFSGGQDSDEPFSSGLGMARYASSVGGVSKSDLLLDEKSMDTVGHGIFPRIGFLDLMEWKKILVVVNDYYVNRAKHVLDFMLGPSYSLVFDDLEDVPSVTPEVVAHEEVGIENFNRFAQGIERGDLDAFIGRAIRNHRLYEGLPKTHFSSSFQSPCLGCSLEESTYN